MKAIVSLFCVCCLLSHAFGCNVPKDAAKLIAAHMIHTNKDFGRIDVSLSEAAPARLRLHPDESTDITYCAVEVEAYPYSKSGEPYLMVVQGIALFSDQGRFVKLVNEGDILWIESKPRLKRGKA